jgi:hypothetical protein
MNTKVLYELTAEAYDNAKVHGFYPGTYDDSDYLAAIHEELSEAFRCWNKHEPWYKLSPKPDGIYFELADAVIRLLSYCGYKGLTLYEYDFSTDRPYTESDLTDMIMLSHGEISQYYEALLNDVDEDEYVQALFVKCAELTLSRFVARIEAFIDEATDSVLSLGELIATKMEYNRTREMKHGGNNV